MERVSQEEGRKTIEPIIEFKDFTFQYYTQSEPTLKNISLRIYPGEKVVIIGPSGSGKSTLVHCINGLIPFAYKGEITGSLKIKGFETREMSIFQISKFVGTVLQDTDAQFVGLTVGEDIAFALENDNVPLEEMRSRVFEAARLVGMENFLNSSPFELSGGQKQRTTIAGVLVDNVDILLFDEPLANLDPATAKRAIEIIDDLHKNLKKTVVIVEHRLEDVLHRPVDRIVLINDGRIVADLDPHAMMCSNLLKSNGLREPLYVVALKYAGIKLEERHAPGYIFSLNLTNQEREQVRNFFRQKFADESGEMWNSGKTSEEQPIVELIDINFSYEPNKPVLRNLNLKIYEGEMISIVGKNGAGKSTFAKLLCGFVKQDSGQLYYRGREITNYTIKERAQIFGFVLQNPNQMLTKTTVYDELALGLRLRRIPEEIVSEKVREVAKVCGLSGMLKWPIAALSYGQKKRVTIASILVLEPEILILDEPTAGQDFRHYSEIMEFLRQLNEQGITVLMITHDMHLIMEYTDRTLVFSDGQIVADLPPSEVLTNPELINRANLKETSLYHLADIVGVENKTVFVQNFIEYDRWVRASDERKVDFVQS